MQKPVDEILSDAPFQYKSTAIIISIIDTNNHDGELQQAALGINNKGAIGSFYTWYQRLYFTTEYIYF